MIGDNQTADTQDGVVTRVVEITLYGILLYIPLENIDAVMEAENTKDLPDNLRGLLSMRGAPFTIHAVIDKFLLSQSRKDQTSDITEEDIQAVIDQDDPYFGTLLAVAAGSDIIFHPNPAATPYANASIKGVYVEQARQKINQMSDDHALTPIAPGGQSPEDGDSGQDA